MITVIDSMPGLGKTSYAIQMINNDRAKGFGTYESEHILNNKYLYVTPFLKEVDRIKENTKAEIYDPDNKNSTKYSDILNLLNNDFSIVMSHELFSRIKNETLEIFKEKDYILIMDEVANVIDDFTISEDDINLLLKSEVISADEENKVVWNDRDYKTNKINKFSDMKILADRESLYFNEKQNKIFKQMSVKSFTSFKEVYILTYLFDGQLQKFFFESHGLKYSLKSVLKKDEHYELIEYDKKTEPRERIKKLLNIYEDIPNTTGRPSTLNSNFNKRAKDERYLLTSGWFKDATKEELRQLNNNLYSYFKVKVPVDKESIFWTTIKDYAPKLTNSKSKYIVKKGKEENTKFNNFLPLNTRATNEYGHCTAMAYIYNRYPNPFKEQYFKQKGIKVNKDLYAVSELIQFLFRGSIRNDKPMNCYIPSKRMRDLLYKWMDFEI